ncbi:hypothetical protein QC761_206657 [Podospora bellae-mahoneyi]|uniref:Uncharacterized protein n=1 Tax=Podospora bellae-mahoneyi TaxID=2093777 RepID=A0ABR0FRB3_9PEZI|nr:hypothetical protein QC761_206657 [Podospora bellae-mahoneyi]
MKHSDSKGLRAKWKALATWWNSIVSAKEKAELEARLSSCQTHLITVLTWSSRLMLENVAEVTEKSNVTLEQLRGYLEVLKSELEMRKIEPD